MNPARLLLVLIALLVQPLWSSAAQAADLKAGLAYVPKDAVGAMTVNVDGVRPTPLFQKVVSSFLQGEPQAKKKLDELKQKTGFDPLRDLHGLIVVAGDFAQNDDDVLFIVEAKIDEARLIAFMKKEGAKIEPKSDALGKYFLFEGGEGAIAFRGKHAIIGGADIVRRALKKEGPSPQLSAALTPLLGKHVAFAGRPNPMLRRKLQKKVPELGQVKLMSGSAHFQNGLQIQTVTTFTTAAPASKLAKQANEGIAQLKQEEQLKRMGLTDLLDRIKISAARTDLRVDVSLTKADVDKLEKLATQFL